MNKGSYNLLVIALIFLAVFLVFHYQPFTWSTEKLQKAYEGDGKIKSKGGLGTPSGYTIEFDVISLSEEIDKKYEIKEVPEIGKDAYISLRVFVGTETLERYKVENNEVLKSIIGISVENAEGKQLVNISAPMDEFWITGHPAELFYSSKNKDTSIDQELWEKGNLIIHLHFKPGKKVFPKGTKGMLLVSCGGHK